MPSDHVLQGIQSLTFYSPLIRIDCGQGGVLLHRKIPIFYSAILLTGVNLLLRLVGTSFQVYISARIGAAGVGLLQLVMSVGEMSMTAAMAGVRTATMYLTAEELGKKRPGNVRSIRRGSGMYGRVCSCAVGFCIYLAAPYLAANWIGDHRTVSAIRLMAVFLPITCLCGVMTGYFTAANRIATLAAVEVAEQLCSMAVTLGTLTFWAGHNPGRSCTAVVLGSCVGACLTFFCLLILRLREQVKAASRIPTARRLLDAAVPLALADDLKAGISTTENLMVPKRLALFPGAADPLALFGVVSGMVFPILMFPAAILFGLAELLIPELARCNAAGSKVRIHYLVRRSLRVAMLYGSLFCGLMFLTAEELCSALYHNADAGIFLKWFALLIPMLYCDAITDAMVKGLGQQKASVRYNILTSALDVIFLYLLLPTYGIAGYFASFLATHLLNFALSIRRLMKITGQKIPFFTPILCMGVVAVGIVLASTLPHPTARVVAYITILGSLLTLFRIISKEDAMWLKSLVHKK